MSADQFTWLFAYGTLRPGGEAFDWLLAEHVAATEPAELPGFALYARGLPYPFVRSHPGARVVGELIRLRGPDYLLVRLDRYEGPQYRRVAVPVLRSDGSKIRAWVYVAAEDVPLHPSQMIESGDWRRT